MSGFHHVRTSDEVKSSPKIDPLVAASDCSIYSFLRSFGETTGVDKLAIHARTPCSITFTPTCAFVVAI